MRGHADESHARATKMRKAETDGQQCFDDIAVSEDEMKVMGAMSQKDPKRRSGDRGTHKTNVVFRYFVGTTREEP